MIFKTGGLYKFTDDTQFSLTLTNLYYQLLHNSKPGLEKYPLCTIVTTFVAILLLRRLVTSFSPWQRTFQLKSSNVMDKVALGSLPYQILFNQILHALLSSGIGTTGPLVVTRN
jgi:hypothetical protein